MELKLKLLVPWFYYPLINTNLLIMKNRFIRVSLVTFIVYIIYTIFFIDDIIDLPLNKNTILNESKNLENKIDSVILEKDSVLEIINE